MQCLENDYDFDWRNSNDFSEGEEEYQPQQIQHYGSYSLSNSNSNSSGSDSDAYVPVEEDYTSKSKRSRVTKSSLRSNISKTTSKRRSISLSSEDALQFEDTLLAELLVQLRYNPTRIIIKEVFVNGTSYSKIEDQMAPLSPSFSSISCTNSVVSAPSSPGSPFGMPLSPTSSMDLASSSIPGSPTHTANGKEVRVPNACEMHKRKHQKCPRNCQYRKKSTKRRKSTE